MNRLAIFFLIFVFVISTAIIKNSSKKIEEKIYKKKENLAILKSEYDLVILEFDFLNSPHEIQKKAEHGINSLTDLERLIYCFWIADYGISNAGDLEVCYDMKPTFKDDAIKISTKLALTETQKLFQLEDQDFIDKYDLLFEEVCNELKAKS